MRGTVIFTSLWKGSLRSLGGTEWGAKDLWLCRGVAAVVRALKVIFVRRFLPALLPVLMLCLLPGKSVAEDPRCVILDDLAAAVHLSELFLEHVETGANSKAPGQLAKLLKSISVAELQLRLNQNGFGKISAPTAKFIALQKTLLKMRKIGGPQKAAEIARTMRYRERLESFRQELAALPCFAGKGRSISGGNDTDDSLISSKTASFSAIFILLAGIGAFLIFDRINKINSRKKKRFLCNASCFVQKTDQDGLIEAQIVDVSMIGAKVKSEATCAVGAEVEVSVPEKKLVFAEHSITYDGWSIVGKVLWRNGNYFGLEFKSVMTQDHLDQLVATS